MVKWHQAKTQNGYDLVMKIYTQRQTQIPLLSVDGFLYKNTVIIRLCSIFRARTRAIHIRRNRTHKEFRDKSRKTVLPKEKRRINERKCMAIEYGYVTVFSSTSSLIHTEKVTRIPNIFFKCWKRVRNERESI